MLAKHWGSINKGWRHIVNYMPEEKKTKILERFNTHFIHNIDKSLVKISVDWGCGGGLLTKELMSFSKVVAIDICQDSLNCCNDYANPTFSYLLPDDLCKFEYKYAIPDLILAHAVTWHFPSFDYFKKTIELWSGLEPKYILFNTKSSDNDFVEKDNYKDDFLDALYVNDDVVADLLHRFGFDMIYKRASLGYLNHQTYFVFECVK